LVALAALLALAATPVLAQNIPAGVDVWNTPGGGETYTTIMGADLDTVCGQGGNVDTTLVLKGVNLPDYGNGDIAIVRESEADLSGGVAVINIHVEDVHFVSVNPVAATCGSLDVDVRPATSAQPATEMTIIREDDLGGVFHADIEIDLAFTFTDANGDELGSLPVFARLLDPQGGTPWAYNPPSNPLDPNAPWFPGVTKTGEAVQVNRIYDPSLGIPASHAYKPPHPVRPPCPRGTGTVGVAGVTETVGQKSTATVGGTTVGGTVGGTVIVDPCAVEIDPVEVGHF
jgi:hypothetical protein